MRTIDDRWTIREVHQRVKLHQERVILHDVFSIDKTRNKAMEIERQQSKAPPFRRPLSIEEPLGGEGVQLSSTTVDLLLAQLTAKAPIWTPTINSVVAKGKENPDIKPEIGKCYRWGEPGNKSNECPKRRQVTMTEYKDEDEV